MRSLKINLPAQWVLPLAAVTLLIPVFILQWQVLQYAQGTPVYPQDEAYVRMAIGKNLAANGTWGLSAGFFSPASSSLLYPLLLAATYKILGSSLWIPFIINLLSALILLVVIQRWLEKNGLIPFSQLLILIAVIFLTPLPIVINIGMEHTLQILFSFLFLTSFCRSISEEGDIKSNRLPWQVFLYAVLAASIRYEGIFLLLIACVFLCFQRKWLQAITLGLIGSIPVLLFGIYSLQQGGYFLPNSVLLKALPIPFNWDGIQKVFTEGIMNKLLFPYPSKGAIGAERIMLLLPLVYWLFLNILRQQRLYRNLLIFCMAMTGLHLAFADTVLFYRYESYLIACAVPIIGLLIAKYPDNLIPRKGAAARWVAVWTGLILLYPLGARSWEAYKDTGKSCIHIYDQGYQAANFLKQFYNHSTVVVYEPGAAAYYSDGKMVDLISGIWGMEVARAKEEDYYRPEFQSFLVQKEHATIAVIPQRDYNPYLFDKWERIGSWATKNNVTLGSPYIMFYAIDKQAAATLKKNLVAYRPLLPRGVIVNYYDEAPKY